MEIIGGVVTNDQIHVFTTDGKYVAAWDGSKPSGPFSGLQRWPSGVDGGVVAVLPIVTETRVQGEVFSTWKRRFDRLWVVTGTELILLPSNFDGSEEIGSLVRRPYSALVPTINELGFAGSDLPDTDPLEGEEGEFSVTAAQRLNRAVQLVTRPSAVRLRHVSSKFGDVDADFPFEEIFRGYGVEGRGRVTALFDVHLSNRGSIHLIDDLGVSTYRETGEPFQEYELVREFSLRSWGLDFESEPTKTLDECVTDALALVEPANLREVLTMSRPYKNSGGAPDKPAVAFASPFEDRSSEMQQANAWETGNRRLSNIDNPSPFLDPAALEKLGLKRDPADGSIATFQPESTLWEALSLRMGGPPYYALDIPAADLHTLARLFAPFSADSGGALLDAGKAPDDEKEEV